MNTISSRQRLILCLAIAVLPGAARAQGAVAEFHVWEVLFAVWVTVVGLGIWLGLRGRLVVFRNAADHGFVLAIWALLFATLVVSNLRLLTVLCLLAAAGAFVVLAVRCAVDNPAPWRWAIALVTKTTLSLLLLSALKDALHPSGETATDRARSQAKGLLWLLALAPLIWRLTRDRPLLGFHAESTLGQLGARKGSGVSQ